MLSDKIAVAVTKLDRKSDSEVEAAWAELRPLGFAIAPYLRAAYPDFAHAAGRAALVYHATRYSRISDDAFELAICALQDRSRIVRYRACGALAYSLRSDAIKPLKGMGNDPDWQVRQSSSAAIFAIREQNHHLFFDRRGEGGTEWKVNPGDGPARRISYITRLRMKASIGERLQ